MRNELCCPRFSIEDNFCFTSSILREACNKFITPYRLLFSLNSAWISILDTSCIVLVRILKFMYYVVLRCFTHSLLPPSLPRTD